MKRILPAAIVLAIIVLAFSASVALAADLAAEKIVVPSTQEAWAPRPLPLAGETLELTLEEAVGWALTNNLDIVIERYGAEIASTRPLEASGFFDVLASGLVQGSHSESPAATNLAGASVQESDTASWNLSARQALPLGGFVSLGWANERIETNSSFFFLNPRYTSGWNLHAEVPVLRDFGCDIARRRILIAQNESDASKEALYLRVSGTILQTENAYWDLVYAIASLQVAEQSLYLARDLERINKIKIDVGTLAPIELVQSEVGVATRQEAIILARAQILDAEDRLKKLLNFSDLSSWTKRVVPRDPPEWEAVSLDPNADIERAMERRPEVRQAVLRIETDKLNHSYAANQTLPRLDVIVDYGYGGLGGTLTVRDENGQVLDVIGGGYSDAIDQVTGFDYPGWTAGLSVSFPIQNRADRARRIQAKLQLDRSLVELRNLEQLIVQEVRRAARVVTTAQESIAATRASVRLAEKNVDAEKKKYENGMTTSFQILQVQDELSSARGRELNATTVYRKALAAYQHAVGKTLDNWNVELAGYFE